MNFKEIAQAWRRASNPTPEELKIAEARHRVCTEPCESYEVLAGIMPYCAECLCPIDKKIFATDKNSCPRKKWSV